MQRSTKRRAWFGRSGERPEDVLGVHALARTSEVYQKVRGAILARQPLSGFHLGRWTMIYPHALGAVGKYPYVLCFGYLDDTSLAGSPEGARPHWYWLPVAHLSHLNAETGPWRSAPAYTQPRLTGFQPDVVVAETQAQPA